MQSRAPGDQRVVPQSSGESDNWSPSLDTVVEECIEEMDSSQGSSSENGEVSHSSF